MVPRVPRRGLSLGSWLHALEQAHLQEWAGVEAADWEVVHDQLTQEFDNYFEEERTLLGDLPTDARRIFRAYLRHWDEDSDRYKVARLGDGSPAIEFIIQVPLDRWGIDTPFKGRIDLLVEDLEYGGEWVWDHKWMKKIPHVDERMMSPQALMYVWGLRKKGRDIRGFLYNYGRTKPPTVPTPLKRGSKYGAAGCLSTKPSMDTDYWTYLEAIRDAHGEDWKRWAKRVYREKLISLKHRQHTDWFRRERIPVEKERVNRGLVEFLVTIKDIERRNKKHPPRAYFYNCPFTCDYHDPCVAEFQGLDIEPLINRHYTFQKERYKGDEATTEQVF